MRKHLAILSFVLFSWLNAQTVTIEWDGVRDYSNGVSPAVSLPFFKNEGYGVRDGVPQFLYTEEVFQNGGVSVRDVRYANLSVTEQGQLNLAEIPEELQVLAKINQAGNRYFISVHLVPFVKENNQVKKVVSFQITRELQNLPTYGVDGGTFDGATQSVLSTGDWYKIKVTQSGVFKLDKSFFQNNKIPSNFDPRTLKIYGNGGKMLNENPGDFRYGALQENAIEFIGEEDGQFDAQDYVLFYAQGPHDWSRLDDSTLHNLSHRFNQYSDEAYYFITFGGEMGKRVQKQNISGNPIQVFNRYDEYVFYEKDSLNINQVGKQWVGKSFNSEASQTYTLEGNASVAGNFVAKYRLVGKAASGVVVNVGLNGLNLPNASFSNGNFTVSQHAVSIQPTGNSFTFTLNSSDITNPGAFVFLDYLSIAYEANLVYNNSQMRFRKLQNLNDGQVYGFSLASAPKVWNISDITSARQVESQNGVYKYQSNHPDFLNEFIAFNDQAAFTDVDYVGRVANQNIRALTGVEYVIVTHPNYLSEAARLANFRSKYSGVKTVVVTTEQVYNEFSSGAQDISAIRDFLKHLRDTGSPLRYALMFGGGSFDYKDRVPQNSNFVPTYISFNSTGIDNSFVTDDFFTMLDDTDIILQNNNRRSPSEFSTIGSTQMDIAVGRLPANNMAEAKLMVDKILAFYEHLPGQGTSFGDWKNKFLLVVDDDAGAVPFHETVETTSAKYIEENIPTAVLRKAYQDAFELQSTSGGGRYPQVNQLIGNAFNLGTSLIVYFGHGGARSWSQARVINYEEINNFSNFSGLYSRLPIVLTITCEFTIWDLPYLPSAGVFMYKSPQGGASAMITTSRPVGVSYGESFNGYLVEQVLTPDGLNYQTLGEALTHAKIGHPSGGGDHLSVNLLGDPMLSISRPPRKVRLTQINGQDAASFDGVLRALDFVEIEGEVLDEAGSMRDNSFNGKASATLFDKPLTKSTLNNRREKDLGVMEFKEQTNAIFKGGTNVQNGQFKFQFYVPKDINYQVGDGRFSVYVHNNVTDGGMATNIKVGDLNPEGLNDDKGPTIGLYMNNLNFVEGGITNRNPYLLACLVDESGINTSGVAIGHDITGVLDQNVENTYVLNEYYEGGDNNPCTNPEYLDYQKGQVMYRLSHLELGQHQISFKVWDINNNSSQQTLDFVVMEEGSDHIYIDKLLNWPNPFTNQTYFHFEHNCDSELQVMVQIFTISGKLVKTIRQPVSAEPWREGYRTGRFAIPWDGLDDFGDKIGKGVYIYRLTAKGTNPEICKGSATAVEKLVILK